MSTELRLYNLYTHVLCHRENYCNFITSVQFDRPDVATNNLSLTNIDSCFCCHNLRTHHTVDGFARVIKRAHHGTVWLAERHLPQNRDVFMAGGDNVGCNIYRYRYY